MATADLATLRGTLATLQRSARLRVDELKEKTDALWVAVQWNMADAVKYQHRDGSQVVAVAMDLHTTLLEIALVEALIAERGT